MSVQAHICFVCLCVRACAWVCACGWARASMWSLACLHSKQALQESDSGTALAPPPAAVTTSPELRTKTRHAIITLPGDAAPSSGFTA